MGLFQALFLIFLAVPLTLGSRVPTVIKVADSEPDQLFPLMEMLPSGINAFPTQVYITARRSDKNVQETPNLVS